VLPQWLATSKRPLDWNGPVGRPFVRFRDEDLDRAIAIQLERVVRRCPDRMAVSDSDTSLTYGQLWQAVSGLAATITAETRTGELVAILLPTSSLSVVALLGCIAASRPCVLLEHHAPECWLAEVMSDARPELVLAADSSSVAPTTPARVLELTRPPQAAPGWQPMENDVDQPAIVLFTSGSTGQPKGIVNSQRNLLQRAAQSTNAAHINATDEFLTLAPLATIVGVRDVITALLAGAGIHLIDPQQASAQEILNVIRSKAITILFAFPALVREIASAAREPAPTPLRLIRIGGDTTLWSDVERLRRWLTPAALIQVIYAATEAPIMQWFVAEACRDNDPRVPIGYPLPGNHLAVVDELGRAIPAGKVGELVVASPYVALGRWVNGRCMADHEPFSDSARRIFHTGDLVRCRPDGLLERLGRKDRQVKIRGHRVELEAVETALRRHSGVRDVGVVARPNRRDGSPTLSAYIGALGEPAAALLEELKAMMRSVPCAMRPARFYLVEELPYLPTSKLDVRNLEALDRKNAESENSGTRLTTSRGPKEGDCIALAVAQAWQKVLSRPSNDPQDDFFALGGDSLRAIALITELERSLGMALAVTLISEAPTFGGLCAALREQRTTEYVPLVLLKAGDDSPPLYLVHGAGGNVAELFPLARSMTCPGAVFGIQARGLARGDPPHTSIEAMAAEYLREIKARQPEGPYHLGGYSLGGLVAYEMARRLSETGDDVGLVGLFDTLPSAVRWPLHVWPAWLARRVGRILIANGEPSAPLDPFVPGFLRSAPASIIKVALSALLASARYRPGFYQGEIHLFVPLGRDPTLPSPEAFWRRHARSVSTFDTPGRHRTMLAVPNAEFMAATLTRCLLGHIVTDSTGHDTQSAMTMLAPLGHSDGLT
jgi:amino acid adenylation domain-containing protein